MARSIPLVSPNPLPSPSDAAGWPADLAAAERGRVAQAWSLDPSVVFLNHGSYGAAPVAVLAHQSELRHRMEAEPVRFFSQELPPLWTEACRGIARFVGAQVEGVALMANATTAVNTVLRGAPLQAGDEILITDHTYAACRLAAEHVAGRRGAGVVTAQVPFPLGDPGQVLQAILAAVTPRTRLALIDHVTSPTGLVFPIDAIVSALEARGIDTLVDGAHAPGMLALDLDALGAAYYTGNCHKWLCAPKGAAFLSVRADRRAALRPLIISHGAAAPAPQRFRGEFDGTGTDDPTAALSAPFAASYLQGLWPGGWPAMRARNRALVAAARRWLCDAWQVAPPAPESMLGSLASIVIGRCDDGPSRGWDPIQLRLYEEHHIQVPIFPWRGQRLLRLSAAAYNRPEQYRTLARALTDMGVIESPRP